MADELTGLDPYFRPGRELGYPGCYAVPAFVNAHAHLELTHHAGFADPEPEDFVAWVNQLVAASKNHGWTRDDYIRGYRQGLDASIRSGNTVVLDHSRRAGYLLDGAREFPGRLITALEFSGFNEDDAEEVFASVRESCERFGDRIGALSPVAPHSISANLYRLACDHARDRGMILCTHLAETVEEVQFLWDGTGPFTRFPAVSGARDMSDFIPLGCTPVEWLNRLGVLGPGTIAAHCNVLTDEDLQILVDTKTHVVHCPPSYRFFGHRTFRLEDLLEAGANLCLGTDSLASSDTLSVLSAMREIGRLYPSLDPERVFAMGTVNGWRAVHRGERLPWPGDVCVLPWSTGKTPARVDRAAMLHDLLTGDSEPVAVFVGGARVWQA